MDALLSVITFMLTWSPFGTVGMLIGAAASDVRQAVRSD